jgi:thiol-disulfide isomerase/thioredoxin
MKQLFALAWLSLSISLAASDGPWLTDLTAAQAQAKKEGKLVFMDFTGSDWCPPCKKLHADILATKDFLAFAGKNLVLVEVDFPNNKPQSEQLKKANEALQEKFKIEGFPTVLVLDAEGKVVFREVGFSGTALPDYIAKLAKLKKK